MNIVAVLYDNRSVLENHHWRSAIACFIESGLARYLLNLPSHMYLNFTFNFNSLYQVSHRLPVL